MITYSSIGIDVISDPDATTASVWFQGERYTGSSKRCPGDKYNEEIGVQLAVARLFGKISRTMERRANGAVKHADDVRKARRERRQAIREQVEDAMLLHMPTTMYPKHNHITRDVKTDGSCAACNEQITRHEIDLPPVGRHRAPEERRS